MRIFFDTSAVVPLLLNEQRSTAAHEIWSTCEEAWAWDWITIETEAAHDLALPLHCGSVVVS